MNHTRETGLRSGADWVETLALDGTERTKHAKDRKQRLTITAQKLKVTGAALLTRQQPPRHQRTAMTKENYHLASFSTSV